MTRIFGRRWCQLFLVIFHRLRNGIDQVTTVHIFTDVNSRSMFPSLLSRQATKFPSFRQFSTGSGGSSRNVVVVGGVRIPFALTSTIYQNEMAVDLQRLAITGLLTQTALPKEAIDYVICGKSQPN